jgi:hypothetical protein
LFEVELAHTIDEESIEEETIRSNANYLDRAQNIELINDFDLLIADLTNLLNEQLVPQPSRAEESKTKPKHTKFNYDVFILQILYQQSRNQHQSPNNNKQHNNKTVNQITCVYFPCANITSTLPPYREKVPS